MHIYRANQITSPEAVLRAMTLFYPAEGLDQAVLAQQSLRNPRQPFD